MLIGATGSKCLYVTCKRRALIGLVSAALLSSVSRTATADEAAKPTAPVPAVLVQKAELKSLDRQYEFIGRVEALEKVDLRARVKGFLGPRLFKDGEDVKQGQILFTIEREPFEADVAQKKAQVASAEATRTFAKQQLDRANELRRSNSSAISEAKVDERIAELAKADAALMEAQAALKDAEINLSYTEIKSPLDGRIGRPSVSPGNLVSPESGVLATVVAEDPVQVLFPVTQRDLLVHRKRSGASGKMTVKVKLADGSLYDEIGQIDFLDVQVNPKTDGQIVRAMMPNPNETLTDGQTVRVVIVQEATSKVVAIPKSAIAVDQSGAYVFIVNDKNVVTQRRVKLGPEKGGQIAIPEGLSENELVVVQGHQRIRNGVTVSVQLATPPKTEQSVSKP
jgi:membrane fusion protein (multidrug efflux system)